MVPFTYYLRYLVTLGKDDRDIIVDMAELGFDVDRSVLESIRRTLMLPRVFSDMAAGAGVTNEKFIVKYARKFQIGELWTYKLRGKPKEVKEMMQLVRDRESRLIPLVLALKKDPAFDTALMDMGREYSPKSVRLMLHYFFNTQIISMTGWRDFFRAFSPEALEALDQPLAYIRHRLGLTPDVSFLNILTDIMYMSYYQSKEHMGVATKDSVAMAKSMAELAIKAGEKLKKYGAGDTRTFLDDVRISFEKADIPIPSIDEVEEFDLLGDQVLFEGDAEE